MQKIPIAIIGCCFVLLISFSAQSRSLTIDDLWALGRVSDVALSPDGNWLAYTVTHYCMETNNSNSDVYVLPASGGEPRQLTQNEGYDGLPRWSPTSQEIAFLSDRDESMQIYILSLLGGEARKASNVPTGVENFIWSPDGKHFAFSTQVYADAQDLQASVRRDEEKQESHVEARTIDGLMYRVWNRWTEGKRSHVFVVPAEGGEAWDVTPGEYDAPPVDLGSVQDFAFAPNGKEIAFVRNIDPMIATSTNNDIFLTPVAGGESRCITTENDAVDNQPIYSPNGKFIAYRSMSRPKFEADQYDLILYNRQSGQKLKVTETFDRDVSEFVWSVDSKFIYFNGYDQGENRIYALDVNKGKIETLIKDHYNSALNISPDGTMLYFTQQAVDRPAEIFQLSLQNKKVEQLTFTNSKLLSQIDMNPAEDFWFKSFDGLRVHGFLIKPPQFDANIKYPLIYLIHGGPQGMWSDEFHYRWNASMFAAPGYVVAMVNFRGSKGYGQKFCDKVSKNWGGGPYEDIMAGLDYLIQTHSFIDKERIAAAGASYGGYMINWIAGHTDRFKVLVSHAGVYDLRSMYGGTEELWFPEWEFDGTPYENPQLYDKWSPSYYAKNFKTPTLVIVGEHDYRVPYTQGLQMFTALQRIGVPSKLLYFPDEDHFVRKPKNAKLWWDTVFAWVDEWINK